jgi:hypothetical protein
MLKNISSDLCRRNRYFFGRNRGFYGRNGHFCGRNKVFYGRNGHLYITKKAAFTPLCTLK